MNLTLLGAASTMHKDKIRSGYFTPSVLASSVLSLVSITPAPLLALCPGKLPKRGGWPWGLCAYGSMPLF